MPIQAKGKRRLIEISCVAWADLLGYGAMLARARFRPGDPLTEEAIDRLRLFQRIGVQRASRNFPAMPINDGIAYFSDLSARSTSVLADFLRRSIETHSAINEADWKAGYPGARMMIAVGPRARVGRPKRSEARLRGIINRVNEGMISVAQALNEAFVSGPVAGFVPALQANFAFSRAYLADEAGGRAGLGGPKCYIDLSIFSQPPPPWVVFARRQQWTDRGLDVWFGELSSVDWKTAGRTSFSGVASCADIADKLGLGPHLPATAKEGGG